MRSRLAAAACGLLACLAVAPTAHAAPVQLVSVGSFDKPIFVTGALGDPTRLYVVQRGGVIKVLKDGQQKTFADLSALLPALDGERGLLSMALAPDFGTSRRFYVYFTGKPPLTRSVGDVVIARLTARDADSADAATLESLVQVPHGLQSNHDGGQLQFGPDGLLYAGTGDGGSGGDPGQNGQYLVDDGRASVGGVDHSPLLGKLLRLDVSPATGYTAPPSNAFGPAGKPGEVWALGVRNPFRFSFDAATGDLLVGDVGQDHREEVDLLPAGTSAGTNLGWSQWEGTRVQSGSPSRTGFTFPALEYGHSADDRTGTTTGCSVTGGYVVRDPNLPELAGQYVYGDFCGGKVRAAKLTATGNTEDRDLGLPAIGQLSSFGEDACGRVYVVDLGGTVSRLSSGGGCTVRPAPTGVPQTPGTPIGGGSGGGGTGDPGTTPGAGGSGVTDKVAPVVRLSSTKAQRALRTGRLRLQVSCDEVCGLAANGTFEVAGRRGGKALKLRTVKQTLDVGARVRVDLRFATSTRRQIARALRSRKAVKARVVLRVNDLSGNRRTTVFRIRIAR